MWLQKLEVPFLSLMHKHRQMAEMYLWVSFSLSLSPLLADFASDICTQIVQHECSLSPSSHPFSLSQTESSLFWLEHELCPCTGLMFTHWGHGLHSCRYHSYLSVVSHSLGMDHYSPSLHSYGNTIHGTTRMTHHWTVGKFFFFSSKVFLTCQHTALGHDQQTIFHCSDTALISPRW